MPGPFYNSKFGCAVSIYQVLAENGLIYSALAKGELRSRLCLRISTFFLVTIQSLCGSGAVLADEANSINKQGEAIYKAAASCQGKRMWTGFGLAEGTLGCAAALSNVLNIAGIREAHSAAVVPLRKQLLKGSHEVTEITIKNGEIACIENELVLNSARPGDLLFAFSEPPSKPNLGGHAHCGIMSFGMFVFTNDWNDGIWKRVDIHSMFDGYRYVRLLRIMPTKRNTK